MRQGGKAFPLGVPNVSNATKVAFFVRILVVPRVRKFGVQNHTHFVNSRTL